MANKNIEARKKVERIFGQFCKNMQNKINDSLGYYELRKNDDFCDKNISFGRNTRHYMSLEFNIGYKEDMDGIYSLVVDIIPRGVLINDSDRFLPESIRNTKAQIDPCSYINQNVFKYKNLDFVSSAGYAFLMKRYKTFRKELMDEVNVNKKRDVLISGVRLRSFNLKYNPEQTIDFYKKKCQGEFPLSEKGCAEIAKMNSNLSNFSLKMKTPTYRSSTIGEAKVSKELEEIANKFRFKTKTKSINKPIKRVKKQFKNPFKAFLTLFKKKDKDIFKDKCDFSFIKSNNVISLILMVIPLIIFIVNIILVLCLKENFTISLSTNILWFNEAFTYKLCGIINNTIAANSNFFVVILLWVCMILAGILETILSLVHLILFLVVALLAAIYGFGFQTMAGAIIVGIAFPIVALILNKISGYKIYAPILSLVINIILVTLYLLCCYLTIGL